MGCGIASIMLDSQVSTMPFQSSCNSMFPKKGNLLTLFFSNFSLVEFIEDNNLRISQAELTHGITREVIGTK